MLVQRLFLLGSVAMALACGGNAGDRPPPPAVPRIDYFKAHCSCQVPFSPAAATYLGMSNGTVPVQADACLPLGYEYKDSAGQYDPVVVAQLAADAADFCGNETAAYVQAELEEIFNAKTGHLASNAACGDGTNPPAVQLFDSPVTCGLIPFENQGPGTDSSEFPPGAEGAKLEPFCNEAYATNTGPTPAVPCDFGLAGNCDLSVDVEQAFDPDACQCDQVQGCASAPVRVLRPAVGNADDPPPVTLFPPQGPIAELSLGRKDGTVTSGSLDLSVSGRACVNVPFEVCDTVSDSDSGALSGGFRLYGGPCEAGHSCNVILEANLAAEDLQLEFSFLGINVGDYDITDFVLFLASGEASVVVDASGHAVIPAGAAQYRAFWRQNGIEKQAIGFFANPLGFDVDWTTRTLTVNSATLSLDGSSATVSLAGTFGQSVLEQLGGLCPGPELGEPEEMTLPACAVGSLASLTPPALVGGCIDETPTIVGEVIFAGGQELNPPILLDAGAQFPAGDIIVRWTASDSRGRVDVVEQAVEVTSRPALVATQSLDLGDRFVVLEPGGVLLGGARNVGPGLSMLGADGRLSDLGSAAKATLRDRSIVTRLVSPVVPELINGASIGGQVFGVPPALAAPALPTYRTSNTDIFVGPNGNRLLAPGAYRNVTVHPTGRLRLSAGDYSFGTLDLHSQSRLDLNKAGGPIRIVVNGSTKLQNSYNHTPSGAAGFVLGSLTQQTVYVETPFRGTLVVPRGSLNLRAVNGVRHEGEFFAKDIKAEAGAAVAHVAGACVAP